MDLFGYIELDASMPETEIKSIFRQVACAIGHLHKNNIVHRDIKDENVILDEDGTIQLIDFGSAAYIQDGKKYNTFRGTLDYAAPEVRWNVERSNVQVLEVYYVLTCVNMGILLTLDVDWSGI